MTFIQVEKWIVYGKNDWNNNKVVAIFDYCSEALKWIDWAKQLDKEDGINMPLYYLDSKTIWVLAK